MKAIEIYQKETGKKRPNNQIALSEFHIEYVEWLEKQVENLMPLPFVMPRFEIEYEFTDSTDKSRHKETFEAEANWQALSAFIRKYNARVVWYSVTKIN